MIEFGISEEEVMIGETAKKFADDHLRKKEREHEKLRSFSEQTRKEYLRLGFDRMSLSESDGGMDLPFTVEMTMLKILAESDPTAPFALSPWGPAARWLTTTPQGKKILSNQSQGAVAFADNNLTFSDNTVSGTIPWLPCPEPNWIALIRNEHIALIHKPHIKEIKGINCGLRASGAVEVIFKDTAFEPCGNAQDAQLLLNESRLFAASIMIGAARDSYNYAAQYTQERVAFGKPIAHHQGLAFALMNTVTSINAADKLLTMAALTMTDNAAIANAYCFANKVASDAADCGVQALGGHGYIHEHPVEKRMRDIRAIAALYGGIFEAEDAVISDILTMNDAMEVA